MNLRAGVDEAVWSAYINGQVGDIPASVVAFIERWFAEFIAAADDHSETIDGTPFDELRVAFSKELEEQ